MIALITILGGALIGVLIALIITAYYQALYSRIFGFTFKKGRTTWKAL